MADISLVKNNIRTYGEEFGCIDNPYTTSYAGAVGDTVYMHTDGTVKLAGAGLATPADRVIGIVTAVFDGSTDFASGTVVSVTEFGPVTGFTGMTPGALQYLSNTAGKIATSAGHYARIVGRALNATTLFLSPVLSDSAST